MAIARRLGDKVYKWQVPDLQVAAAGLPVEEISTDRFNLNVDAWFAEACAPTISNVVHHMKFIQSVDLNNPIPLSAEGRSLAEQLTTYHAVAILNVLIQHVA